MTTTILRKENYIRLIKNSIDSKLFKNLYLDIDGNKKDITENGNLSCAYFASSILYIAGLIKGVHATVNGTIKDLEEFGWVQTDKPEIGSILVWAETNFDGQESHKHIGFYIEENKAIMNDSKSGTPIEHDWQFNNERKVEKILRFPNL